MSSGPGLYGPQDTIDFEDLGHSIRKQCYFHHDSIPHLITWIESLRYADCIQYTHSSIVFNSHTKTITFERPKVIGTIISSLDVYDDKVIALWDDFVDRLVSAGDQFDTYGYGYIHIEPKELQNYIIDHDDVIQALDVETSFMIVYDRALFDEYVENARQLMKLELQRYVILRKIERDGS